MAPGSPRPKFCRSRRAGTPGSTPDTRQLTPEAPDDTLGGYREVHGRPPAFGGSDGHAYTVAASVAEGPGPQGRYGAYLLFVRWQEGADRPSGHLETGYLADGATEAAALGPVLALTLREVKDHLERLIHDRGKLGAEGG
jgi:hypothetical protein